MFEVGRLGKGLVTMEKKLRYYSQLSCPELAYVPRSGNWDISNTIAYNAWLFAIEKAMVLTREISKILQPRAPRICENLRPENYTETVVGEQAKFCESQPRSESSLCKKCPVFRVEKRHRFSDQKREPILQIVDQKLQQLAQKTVPFFGPKNGPLFRTEKWTELCQNISS